MTCELNKTSELYPFVMPTKYIYEYGINGVDFMLSPLLKSSQPFFAFVCFDRYCKNAFHQLLKIPQRTPEDPTFKRLVFGSIPFSTPALHCLLLYVAWKITNTREQIAQNLCAQPFSKILIIIWNTIFKWFGRENWANLSFIFPLLRHTFCVHFHSVFWIT